MLQLQERRGNKRRTYRSKHDTELATFLLFSRGESDPKLFVQDEHGTTPEEAFRRVTSRGKRYVKTTDAFRAGQYLLGKRRFNITFEMWKVDIQDGILSKDELILCYMPTPCFPYIEKRLRKI